VMDRKYYAFDLDGTLGDFHDYLHDYIDFFKMQISNDAAYKIKLDAAYKIFIEKIAEKTDIRECTLFNLDMIFLIIRENVSDAVIYSNNSDPNVLAFAKDVIEALVKRPVFCYLMHWNHKFRNNEIVRGDRGNARKTMPVLKRAFAECGHDVKPEQVVFYDDQIHPDLVENLRENYIHIDAYRADSNKKLTSKLFIESINESGINQPLVANNNFNELVPINQEGGKRTRSRYRRRKVNKKTNKKRKSK